MAEGSQGRVISDLREVSDGGGLQKPGGAVVALVVAREACEAGSVQPIEVVGEPFLQGGVVGLSEGFRVGEEG